MKKMKLLIIVAICSTMLNASITLGDALRTRAIGSGGERVILGDVSDNKRVTSSQPNTPLPPLSTDLPSTKLQECYNHVKEVVDRAMRSNQNNDPSQSIGIVSLDGSTQCQEAHKKCAEEAWQRGKRCFTSSHAGMTPTQIANRCNTISNQGAIKCVVEENRCSSSSMIAKCKSKYANVSSNESSNIQNNNIETIDNDNILSDVEYERKEYIKQYQQDIETIKHRLDRAEARLRAEREKGVNDRYHKQRIKIYQDSIYTLRKELQNNKSQLRELGGVERRHIHRDQRDIYRDIEHNRAIYNNQQELKSKQHELTNIIKIIDNFGNDYETKRLTINKVKELSKNASLDKLKAIKSAVRKQYYDAWVSEQESETIKQLEIDKELSISENRTILIRDTAATINKTLGLAYGNVAGVVATVHGVTNNAVDAIYKDKEAGAVVSIVKDMVDNYTFKLGGELIDIPFRLYKYYHNGVEVPSDMKVYDKDGNLLTKVKSTEMLYDVNGNNINYSFVRRLERYKLWTTTARDDILHKDINKKANGFLDTIDNGKKLGELIWSL